MLTHGEKREYVVASIVDRIVAGELTGGDRLVTQDLAESLGVSLTPVREALAELAGLGLVDLLPNRGATIHRFSRKEIRHVCRVRRALECEAVRGAVGRIPDKSLLRMEQQFAKLSQGPLRGKRAIRVAQELDSLLHDLIAEHCGNPFLKKELDRLTRLFRSFRDASWIDAASRDDCERLSEEAREHLGIVQALRREDRAEAMRAMSQHISSSARYWSRGHRRIDASPKKNDLGV